MITRLQRTALVFSPRSGGVFSLLLLQWLGDAYVNRTESTVRRAPTWVLVRSNVWNPGQTEHRAAAAAASPWVQCGRSPALSVEALLLVPARQRTSPADSRWDGKWRTRPEGPPRTAPERSMWKYTEYCAETLTPVQLHTAGLQIVPGITNSREACLHFKPASPPP